MSWADTTRFVGLACARKALESPDRNSDAASLSDESLLARCADDDHAALTVLFGRYYGLLRMVSRRILQDDYEADDLVQEVFLWILRQARVYDSSKSSGRSWLVQITYRRAISRRRYLKTRGHYQRPELFEGPSDAGACSEVERGLSIEVICARECLERMMAELSAEQYETLRLYFYEGYTLAEVAIKLGQNLGSVRNHYYRGLEKLRKQIVGS